ncbi:hypothetical protein [Bacillus sp. SJS]|uniref:hypothetical protein n=1 Tax=Bacillus sp. SJS TaxID=1423321 RepID=UPI0004DD0E59|nr:hypothetical protein [Bacillus sp. SJS]KZZ85051.1 hypothetical protein AS29_008360 [Bacillus sp. SJS]
MSQFTRRKRNFQYDFNKNRGNEPIREEEYEDIEEEYEDLEEGYEYDEEGFQPEDHESDPIEDDKEENQVFILNGKPFVPKETIERKKTFAETHVRVTTYLEMNVHQIVHMLQKNGKIESITKLVNESIKDYLMNHYHNDN